MKKKIATQPTTTKGHIAAAADACDEGAGRLDVVLCMLRAFHENDLAQGVGCDYEFEIMQELLMDLRDRLARGSAEYVKAIEEEERAKGGA